MPHFARLYEELELQVANTPEEIAYVKGLQAGRLEVRTSIRNVFLGLVTGFVCVFVFIEFVA